MFNVVLLIAFITDALVFLYILLKSYVERSDLKKINEVIIKRAEENIENRKSKPAKFGAAFGAFVFGLILIGVGIMPIIALISKWIQGGFIVGLRYFLIYSLFWPLFNAFIRTFKKNKTITNERQRLSIMMYLALVFISIMYTKFGFDISFYEVIEYYSTSNLSFSNSLVILIPALLVFSIILTFYSAISKVSLLNIDDIHYPHWTTKYPFILTVLVISIYYVLIYISELSQELKQAIDYFDMSDTLAIIQNILAAALIPLVLGIFLNANGEGRQKNLVIEDEIKKIQNNESVELENSKTM